MKYNLTFPKDRPRNKTHWIKIKNEFEMNYDAIIFRNVTSNFLSAAISARERGVSLDAFKSLCEECLTARGGSYY